MSDHSRVTSTTIRIAGMHCPSCDILVKTQLENLTGIVDVIPDHRKNLVTIRHKGPLSLKQINAVLCEYGYKVSNVDDVLMEAPVQDKLTEALIIAAILGILYFFAKEFRLLPESMGGTVTTVGGAFVLGLVASASTCMATTGALFVSFIHKQTSKDHIASLAGLFIAGRIVSYALFGYILGYFGQGFAYITQLGSVLNIIIAGILVVAGLDMLRLVSLSRILDALHIQPSKFFPAGTKTKSIIGGAFTLGFITYFLPCGFTLSTQAYALSIGNPLLSSQIMVAFALGTIPSLIFIALLSNIRHTTVYQYFLKVVGVVIIAVGISYVWSTLSLHGLTPFTSQSTETFAGETAEFVDGKQVVKMTATSLGYSPNKFIVRKNIPVRWEIDGQEVYGCQGTLQSPQAGIQLTNLKEGENVFEFTPKETGIINFSCSMGMFSGQFKVIDG